MAKWPVSMKDEQDRAPLLTEGWREFIIVSVKHVSEDESKSGNPYFTWDMKCDEGTIQMRTTLIKGKRWLLKQVLSACGIEAKADDPEKKYAFGPEDVEGKSVFGKVVTKEQKPFTLDNGEVVNPEPRSEINRVKKIGSVTEVSKNTTSINYDDVPF